VTQKASESDDPGLDQTFQDQALSGLDRPTELYVDGAYVSAARLREAKDQGWELIGPANPVLIDCNYQALIASRLSILASPRALLAVREDMKIPSAVGSKKPNVKT
jgi:hypothetical protein